MVSTPPVSATERPLKLAGWTNTMQRSVLRQMLVVISQPGILSFAGGLPAPDLFPTAEYSAAVAQVLQSDASALQYGPPFRPLKRHIVDLMAQRGVECAEDQVFLTTGAQQALDVLSRLLLDDGGQVMLEELVYTGIRQVVAPCRAEILSIPTDLETGIDVDAIVDHLEAGARPAFLYVIPDAHNPLGVSISADRRRRLVEITAAYGLPIIEDDPYGFLSYDGRCLPPLKAYGEAHVFYVGSFSKILAPALRLGWLIAPEELAAKLTVIKEAGDLESSALTQRAVSAYLDAGHLPAHISRLQEEYGRRRDTMLAAMARHFPPGVTRTRPRGGMFIWVTLPDGVDTGALLETAVARERVAFIPGHAFAGPGVQARNHMRLNFSNCCLADIEEGIRRLGRVLEEVTSDE
jgi:2-aminoadipate transaminase